MEALGRVPAPSHVFVSWKCEFRSREATSEGTNLKKS